MRLGELVPDLDVPDPALDVTGVTADSRRAGPGMVFAALKGTKTDGTAFVAEALAKGAVAILHDGSVAVDAPVVLVDPDPRRRLALMAARLAGPQPETIVAVTGTAGKTSVAEFTRQIFTAAGHRAVSVGTLGIHGAVTVKGGLTTPDPVALHERLAALAAEGVTHVAMEASSHGIEQRRLDGVRLAAAGFTNIGRDHLDYHATPEAYLAAKLRLFEVLQPNGAQTVVDPDQPGADAVLRVAPEAFTVGRHGTGLRLVAETPSEEGARLVIEANGVSHNIHLPLIGAFQVENALVAAGLAIAAGVPEGEAIAALAGLQGAPGRLELVGRADGAPIFVDYAHKPDAVTAALTALRPRVSGRLVVVIGAGGDRDPGKRPLMGAAAHAIADIVIVTDDNPRSEDPATIRAAVLAGAPGAIEIGDRAAAIREAIAMLRAGDALVVAGKGHEEGQIVGDTVLPFSDHSAVIAALEGR
ncbi:UDP-N-acetylmuramoyl-L-alanyl-D-glutamate--2,6-diaminopimelate ligase [Acuticoccus sp. M5D2P5]|uniref:UDP-N-acetylmuramoyl-L-alanyl-D-glutamate--2, 6-diaminopimelate ligase n=1 Tax=Acuticoccus kalidii TaxID=2910977 RepID=UPI001F25A0BE|nr:UDP-N-acetylmuramoyl-L-alanyl-D-glutamate--2,6-diaminopimelate ligase [Acuticoccus kalidii]MCF3936439.1 UDP-N-acetylmuramoyl-L-alanyl-D-glutamate--2,6-diaminopimelate ligase [Acuticoccus kalidii]